MAVQSDTQKTILGSAIAGFCGNTRGEFHLEYDHKIKMYSHAGEALIKLGDFFYTVGDVKSMVSEMELFQKQLDLDTRETLAFED